LKNGQRRAEDDDPMDGEGRATLGAKAEMRNPEVISCTSLMLRPVIVAIQFLTRIPIPLKKPATETELRYSIVYYPVVGVLIGLLLVIVAGLIMHTSEILSAALVLTLWVFLTGGLHLDGLADSADAWVGGLGDRTRSLAIMKDPYSGPAGVNALVLVLIIKFAALQSMISIAPWAVFIMIPALARVAVPLLFMTTPYVRESGLGTPLSNPPRRLCCWSLGLTALATVLLNGGAGFAMLAIALLVFLFLRRIMLKRIGGATGDTTGAMIEILETVLLVCAAFVYSS